MNQYPMSSTMTIMTILLLNLSHGLITPDSFPYLSVAIILPRTWDLIWPNNTGCHFYSQVWSLVGDINGINSASLAIIDNRWGWNQFVATAWQDGFVPGWPGPVVFFSWACTFCFHLRLCSGHDHSARSEGLGYFNVVSSRIICF